MSLVVRIVEKKEATIPAHLKPYRYSGAASLVLLHEEHLKTFVAVWREAKAHRLELPQTDDPAYESLEGVLQHVLGAAGRYLTWCCEKLDLENPDVEAPPALDRMEAEADRYLAHVLDRWREPLAEVPEERFDVVYESRWGVGYCVDAMLEHAVMHPIRHTFQLKRLMREQAFGTALGSCENAKQA